MATEIDEQLRTRKITSKEDYAAYFRGLEGAALEKAHDIRKFEIELYWKRASYFWTIIAVAFAGFFSLSAAQSGGANAFAIACLGLVVSLGWYQVNRASSAWQRNWEVHVDLLEDTVTGPLHKTIMNRDAHAFWDLAGPYAYSPSRLNAILSLMVVGAWIILLLSTAWASWKSGAPMGSIYAFSLLLFIGVYSMFAFANSGHTRKYRVRTLQGKMRQYQEGGA